jgi:hypothetical protein
MFLALGLLTVAGCRKETHGDPANRITEGWGLFRSGDFGPAVAAFESGDFDMAREYYLPEAHRRVPGGTARVLRQAGTTADGRSGRNLAGGDAIGRGVPTMKTVWSFLETYFAVLVVASAYLWSILAVATARRALVPAGTQVELRIGHWQLEAGVREYIKFWGADDGWLCAGQHPDHPAVRLLHETVRTGAYRGCRQGIGAQASDSCAAVCDRDSPLPAQWSQRFRPVCNVPLR